MSELPAKKKTIFKHLMLLGFNSLFFGWWNPAFIPFSQGALLIGCERHGKKRSIYHRWTIAFLISVAAILTALGIFNYVIDPLWCFPGSNRWNNRQIPFDERQQKTNLVTFGTFDYSTIILGSSRTALINQKNFRGLDAFNYSVSSMVPNEYPDYLAYAKKRRGREFHDIILGLDFYGTNANLKKTAEKPDHYINKANSLFYRYNMLFNKDAVKYSYENIKESYHKSKISGYDRFNVMTLKASTRKEHEMVNNYQLLWYKQEGYGSNYKYDENLKSILNKLLVDNPGSKFTVFTTPVSKPLFCLMVRENRFPDYERWIRDVVDTYGQVYNFMDLNSVTKDYMDSFLDIHHMAPRTCEMVAHKVMGIRDDAIPDDFGKLVTRENLEEHIASLRANRAGCE